MDRVSLATIRQIGERLARLETQQAAAASSLRASATTVHDSSLEVSVTVPVTDDVGEYVVDELGLIETVREDALRIGVQDDGSTTVVHLTGMKPWTPSVPTCTGTVGSISVIWDGLYMDDEDTDIDESRASYEDFARVEVHAGVQGDDQTLDTGTVNSRTRQATIETALGGGVAVVLEPGTYWIALVAVNRAGEYGDPSYSVNVASLDGAGMTEEERLKLDKAAQDAIAAANAAAAAQQSADAAQQYAEDVSDQVAQNKQLVDAAMANVEADVDAAQSALVTLDGKVATASTDIAGLKSADAAFNTRMATAESDLTGVKNSATALTTRVTTAEGTLTSHTGTLSTLDGKMTNITTRVTDAEGKVTSQGNRLTTAEGTIATQGTRLTTAEGTVSTQGTKINTLTGDLTSVTTRVTTAEGDVSKLKTDLTATNGSVSSLTTRVGTAETGLTTVRNDLATTDGKVTTVTGRVTTVEGKVTTAEQNITANSVSITQVRQMGTDLVRNGNAAAKSNANFEGYFDYNGVDAPAGTLGSFVPRSTVAHPVVITDLIPFNPGKAYRLSFMARQTVPGATNRLSGLISPYDADGLSILPQHYMYISGTTTTLAQDLKPGDTKIYLTSVANWFGQAGKAAGNATYLRTFTAWNYTDGAGKTWETGSYSRNVWMDQWADGAVDLATNSITLKASWPSDRGGTIPAGTPVSNGTSGGAYLYAPSAVSVLVPETWTTYADTYSSGVMSRSAQAVAGSSGASWASGLPEATASIKVGWLVNYPASPANPTVGRHAIAGVSFSDASAATAIAQGKSKVTYSTAAPGATVGVAGDTWFRQDSVGSVVSVWQHNGSTWVERQISGTALVADSVTAAQIAAGAVTANEIAAGAVTTLKLAAGAVTANELAAGSVVAGKIATDAVVAASIAAGAITTAKIAAGAVTANEMKAGTITAASGILADASIGTAQIQDAAVTNAKVVNLGVDKLVAGTATVDQAVANAIWVKALVANKIQAGQIAAGAISTTELAANAVTAEKIYANAIRTEHIQSGAVTADAIQAGAITANKLAVGAVSGNLLSVGSFEDKAFRASATSVGTNYYRDPSFTAWNTSIVASGYPALYPLTRTAVSGLPDTPGYDIARGAYAATITVNSLNATFKPALFFYSTGVGGAFSLKTNNFFGLFHLSTKGVAYWALPWVGVYDGAGNYLGDYDGSVFGGSASPTWSLSYVNFTSAQVKAKYPSAAKFAPALNVHNSTGGDVPAGFVLHVTSVTVSDSPVLPYIYDNIISPISLQATVENLPQGAIGSSYTTSLKMPSGVVGPSGMSLSGSIFNISGWTLDREFTVSSMHLPGVAYVTHSGGSSGTGALALRGAALNDGAERLSRATSTGFDVTPHQGGTLVVSAKVRSNSYVGGLSSTLRVSVLFKDSAGSVVSSAATATTAPSSVSSWAPVAWTIQVPSDAVTAQIQLIQPNSKTTNRIEPVYVDEVAVYPQGQNTSDLSGIGLRMWDDQGTQGVYITPQQTVLNNPVTIGGSLSINGNTDINGTMYWNHQGNRAGRISSDNGGVSLGAYRNDNSGVLLHGVWVNRGTGLVTFPNGVDLTGDGLREAALPLPGGWANYGSDGSGDYIPLRVQALGVKTAVLHGMIKVSTAAAAGSLVSTPAGTLPTWARPRENALTFVTLSNKSVARVGIYADGRVMFYHVDAMTVGSYGAFSLTYPL